MNTPKRDFRLLMLHENKLGHNASETSTNINRAWGEGSTSDRTVRRWFQKFRSGDENLEDEGRERACSLDNEKLQAVVEQNPHVSVRKMTQTLGVSTATVSRHLQSIGKVKKSINGSLMSSMSIKNLRNTNDPFLDRIVTCDEKWILYDNRKRSVLWLDRDESPKHFPNPKLHQQRLW